MSGSSSLYLVGRIWHCWYYDARGKRIRQTTGKTSEREAKRFLADQLVKVGAKLAVGPAAERVKFDYLADYWWERKKDSAWGQRGLGTIVENLKAFLGHYRAVEVEPRIIQQYLDWRREGNPNITDATLNRDMAVLRAIYSMARDYGIVAHDVRVRILMTSERNARQTYLTREEFNRLRASIAVEFWNWITFLYLTGMRYGQAAAIELRDVHMEQGVIVCRPETAKNREEYVLPLVGAVGEVVGEAWAARRLDCPYLFHADGRGLAYPDGSQLTAFRDAWLEATKAAGLVGRRPHDFRRSAMRELLDAGVDLKSAMLVTGHKNAAVAQRYNIRTLADRTRAIEMREKHQGGKLLPISGEKK